jgi:hypothetical protein
MMLGVILQGFAEEAQADIEQLQEELEATHDIAGFERGLKEIVEKLAAEVLQKTIEEVMAKPEMLTVLKRVGGKLALRYKEYRVVTVKIYTGQSISVKTPYFVRAQPKRGRKKRGPNGSGSYLGLEVLGFIPLHLKADKGY